MPKQQDINAAKAETKCRKSSLLKLLLKFPIFTLHLKSFISTPQNGDSQFEVSVYREERKVKPIWKDQEHSSKLVYQRKNQISVYIQKENY